MMRRSVRSHVIVASLLVSLAAILAIGLVTLLLVNTYFSDQEEEYLEDRGHELIEPLEVVLGQGGGLFDLQQMASFGLLSSRIRVRVYDVKGRLMVDSGTLSDLIPKFQIDEPQPFSRAFQFYVDEFGRFQSFHSSESVLEVFPGLYGRDRPRDDNRTLFPAVDPGPQPPVTAISGASLRIPLQVEGDIVAFAELSDGPAYGTAIRASLQKALLIGGLAAVIVAGIAGFFAARRVTKPLIALGEAADEMATGNLEARAPRSNLTEYDRLARRFNRMADRLASTIASLEADRSALRRFIANASHELRTPLTALKTFNELLAQNTMAKQEPASSFIIESGNQLSRMDRLTGDLLDLSRFEARLSGTDFASVDIRPVVERSIQSIRPMSEVKNQQLEMLLPPDGSCSTVTFRPWKERSVTWLIMPSSSLPPVVRSW